MSMGQGQSGLSKQGRHCPQQVVGVREPVVWLELTQSAAWLPERSLESSASPLHSQGSCRPHPEFQGRGHKPHEVAATCLAPGPELGTEVGPHPHLLTHGIMQRS